MCQRQIDAWQLDARRGSADLMRSLDHGKDSVHPRMRAGQPAAVGVDRKRSARCNPAIRHKRPTFTLGAKAKVLQKQHGVDGESIIKLQHVDV